MGGIVSPFGKPFLKGFLESWPNFAVVLCVELWRKEITWRQTPGQARWVGNAKERLIRGF